VLAAHIGRRPFPDTAPDFIPSIPQDSKLYILISMANITNHLPSQFLSLPQELRDIIYTSLLSEHRPAPQDPDSAGPRFRPGRRKIFFEFGSPKPALLHLKLVNKQLYAEVQDLLTKYDDRGGGEARLDLMIAGSSVWPTWTKLPVTATSSIMWGSDTC